MLIMQYSKCTYITIFLQIEQLCGNTPNLSYLKCQTSGFRLVFTKNVLIMLISSAYRYSWSSPSKMHNWEHWFRG